MEDVMMMTGGAGAADMESERCEVRTNAPAADAATVSRAADEAASACSAGIAEHLWKRRERLQHKFSLRSKIRSLREEEDIDMQEVEEGKKEKEEEEGRRKNLTAMSLREGGKWKDRTHASRAEEALMMKMPLSECDWHAFPVTKKSLSHDSSISVVCSVTSPSSPLAGSAATVAGSAATVAGSAATVAGSAGVAGAAGAGEVSEAESFSFTTTPACSVAVSSSPSVCRSHAQSVSANKTLDLLAMSSNKKSVCVSHATSSVRNTPHFAALSSNHKNIDIQEPLLCDGAFVGVTMPVPQQQQEGPPTCHRRYGGRYGLATAAAASASDMVRASNGKMCWGSRRTTHHPTPVVATCQSNSTSVVTENSPPPAPTPTPPPPHSPHPPHPPRRPPCPPLSPAGDMTVPRRAAPTAAAACAVDKRRFYVTSAAGASMNTTAAPLYVRLKRKRQEEVLPFLCMLSPVQQCLGGTSSSQRTLRTGARTTPATSSHWCTNGCLSATEGTCSECLSSNNGDRRHRHLPTITTQVIERSEARAGSSQQFLQTHPRILIFRHMSDPPQLLRDPLKKKKTKVKNAIATTATDRSSFPANTHPLPIFATTTTIISTTSSTTATTATGSAVAATDTSADVAAAVAGRSTSSHLAISLPQNAAPRPFVPLSAASLATADKPPGTKLCIHHDASARELSRTRPSVTPATPSSSCRTAAPYRDKNTFPHGAAETPVDNQTSPRDAVAAVSAISVFSTDSATAFPQTNRSPHGGAPEIAENNTPTMVPGRRPFFSPVVPAPVGTWMISSTSCGEASGVSVNHSDSGSSSNSSTNNTTTATTSSSSSSSAAAVTLYTAAGTSSGAVTTLTDSTTTNTTIAALQEECRELFRVFTKRTGDVFAGAVGKKEVLQEEKEGAPDEVMDTCLYDKGDRKTHSTYSKGTGNVCGANKYGEEKKCCNMEKGGVGSSLWWSTKLADISADVPEAAAPATARYQAAAARYAAAASKQEAAARTWLPTSAGRASPRGPAAGQRSLSTSIASQSAAPRKYITLVQNVEEGEERGTATRRRSAATVERKREVIGLTIDAEAADICCSRGPSLVDMKQVGAKHDMGGHVTCGGGGGEVVTADTSSSSSLLDRFVPVACEKETALNISSLSSSWDGCSATAVGCGGCSGAAADTAGADTAAATAATAAATAARDIRLPVQVTTEKETHNYIKQRNTWEAKNMQTDVATLELLLLQQQQQALATFHVLPSGSRQRRQQHAATPPHASTPPHAAVPNKQRLSTYATFRDADGSKYVDTSSCSSCCSRTSRDKNNNNNSSGSYIKKNSSSYCSSNSSSSSSSSSRCKNSRSGSAEGGVQSSRGRGGGRRREDIIGKKHSGQRSATRCYRLQDGRKVRVLEVGRVTRAKRLRVEQEEEEAGELYSGGRASACVLGERGGDDIIEICAAQGGGEGQRQQRSKEEEATGTTERREQEEREEKVEEEVRGERKDKEVKEIIEEAQDGREEGFKDISKDNNSNGMMFQQQGKRLCRQQESAIVTTESKGVGGEGGGRRKMMGARVQVISEKALLGKSREKNIFSEKQKKNEYRADNDDDDDENHEYEWYKLECPSSLGEEGCDPNTYGNTYDEGNIFCSLMQTSAASTTSTIPAAATEVAAMAVAATAAAQGEGIGEDAAASAIGIIELDEPLDEPLQGTSSAANSDADSDDATMLQSSRLFLEEMGDIDDPFSDDDEDGAEIDYPDSSSDAEEEGYISRWRGRGANRRRWGGSCSLYTGDVRCYIDSEEESSERERRKRDDDEEEESEGSYYGGGSDISDY